MGNHQTTDTAARWIGATMLAALAFGLPWGLVALAEESETFRRGVASFVGRAQAQANKEHRPVIVLEPIVLRRDEISKALAPQVSAEEEP